MLFWEQYLIHMISYQQYLGWQLQLKRADEQHEKIISELDRRKQKRRKDVDEFKVVEGVIDSPTLKTLYKLLNRGTIRALHGAISTGKEANVYRGEDADGK